jgi:anti-sigma B factor antagonist
MNMQFSEVDGLKKVSLSGRLDSGSIDLLEARFGAAVVGSGMNTMVDLTDVAFLASLAVRMFISTTRSLATRGGKLVMFGANDAVMEIIDAIGFSDIVPVVATQSDAIALLMG